MSGGRVVWRELHFQRPLDAERARALLRGIATDHQLGVVRFELRGHEGLVQYLVGVEPGRLHRLEQLVAGLLPTSRLTDTADRTAAHDVVRVKASTPHRSLRSDEPERGVRAVLGAMASARAGERVVLQVVLGPRRVPLAVPSNSPLSMTRPWWHALWYGDAKEADSERRKSLAAKVSDHGFACEVRIGSTAVAVRRRQRLVSGVMAALRTNETPGLKLSLGPSRTRRLNEGVPPLLRWTLRLGVPELLVALGWPVGDQDMPGVASLHPRRLPPSPLATKPFGRVMGRSGAPGHESELLRMSAPDMTRHVHLVGPTGTGKTVLAANIAAATMAEGYGLVVIEPKDLVKSILTQVPKNRMRDVVVLDALDPSPVGLNPLRRAGASADSKTEALMSVFRSLYGDALGPRSSDVLHSTLLTLSRHHESPSLAMLPLMWTSEAFRRSVTDRVDDVIGLRPYWEWFNDGISDAERRTITAPILNKTRPFLLNRALRGVISQPNPRFDVSQVFTERKILLVPLDEERLGAGAGTLLGSLVFALVWQAVQARSVVPEERRAPVTVIIDELSRYVHLPTDLSDALILARSYGCAIVGIHQHLAQLPKELQAAILANARSRILFAQSAADAAVFARGHPEVTPDDLTALSAYETYQSLNIDNTATPYAFAKTLPLPPAISRPDAVRALSRQQFGRPIAEVEAYFKSLVDGPEERGAVGRRRRQP